MTEAERKGIVRMQTAAMSGWWIGGSWMPPTHNENASLAGWHTRDSPQHEGGSDTAEYLCKSYSWR
eukprot:12920832-Prorocentrum_lima.AAC.1